MLGDILLITTFIFCVIGYSNVLQWPILFDLVFYIILDKHDRYKPLQWPQTGSILLTLGKSSSNYLILSNDCILKLVSDATIIRYYYYQMIIVDTCNYQIASNSKHVQLLNNCSYEQVFTWTSVHMNKCSHEHMNIWAYEHMNIWTYEHMNNCSPGLPCAHAREYAPFS